jgi:hypothetical protein
METIIGPHIELFLVRIKKASVYIFGRISVPSFYERHNILISKNQKQLW